MCVRDVTTPSLSVMLVVVGDVVIRCWDHCQCVDTDVQVEMIELIKKIEYD